MTAAAASPDVAGTVFDVETAALAKNYAEALLNASAAANETDAALEDLESIVRDVLEANPRFASILASPTTPGPEKDRILVDAFEGKASPTVVRFLRVLNRHDRLAILAAVVRQARATWGPPPGPQAGHGPLGRAARRGAADGHPRPPGRHDPRHARTHAGSRPVPDRWPGRPGRRRRL